MSTSSIRNSNHAVNKCHHESALSFPSSSHVNLKPGFFGGRKQLESDDHFVLEIGVYKVILNLFLM